MTAPITGRFDLIDHNGTPVTELTYKGSWVLVLFGFTNCRVVCPRALARLSAALDSLERPERVQGLYITVDPERDTPQVMKAFLAEQYPRFIGLTGTPEQVEAAKESFLIFARRKADPDDPAGYQVPHTAVSYLLDPQGAYAVHWTDAHDPADMAASLAALVDDEPRASR